MEIIRLALQTAETAQGIKLEFIDDWEFLDAVDGNENLFGSYDSDSPSHCDCFTGIYLVRNGRWYLAQSTMCLPVTACASLFLCFPVIRVTVLRINICCR
jgi:hypothetical protein